MPDNKINPQPLPPRVDLGELTTAVRRPSATRWNPGPQRRIPLSFFVIPTS